ncbi:hypothetical protein HHI36_017057 [Cryptolaemus montrouzieri]|uniref:Uncharacterized protein n=1 Tax=Cryptolaemus montrouzieri TaxID=559131 RepID=A0ABD2NLQ7_9CUCU
MMAHEFYNDRILHPSRLSVARNLFGVQRDLNCDRFIPCRANNNWQTNFAVIPDSNKNLQISKKSRDNGENNRDSSVYNVLLRNEILQENNEDVKSQCDDRQILTPTKSRNLFKYGTPKKMSRRPLTQSAIIDEILREDGETESKLSDQGSETYRFRGTQSFEESSRSDSEEENLPVAEFRCFMRRNKVTKGLKSNNNRVRRQVQIILTVHRRERATMLNLPRKLNRNIGEHLNMDVEKVAGNEASTSFSTRRGAAKYVQQKKETIEDTIHFLSEKYLQKP